MGIGLRARRDILMGFSNTCRSTPLGAQSTLGTCLGSSGPSGPLEGLRSQPGRIELTTFAQSSLGRRLDPWVGAINPSLDVHSHSVIDTMTASAVTSIHLFTHQGPRKDERLRLN